jgi:hypothetical protein
MVSENQIQEILENHYTELEEYCKSLAREYLHHLDSDIRVEYNHLYPFLYESISMKKRVELFNKLTIKYTSEKGLYF